MKIRTNSGAVVAAAAALLFSAAMGGSAFAAEAAKVHCDSVNSCKGQSSCKTANNACKGQNSCKGKGFLELTKKECKAAQKQMKKEMQKPM